MMQGLIKCYRCGQHNAPGGRFCAYCGTSMAYSCPRCRSVVYPGAQVCTYCNMPLNWNQQQPALNVAGSARCSSCGSPMNLGAERCGYCGLQLKPNQEKYVENVAKAEKAAVPKPAGKKSLNLVSWVATTALAAFILFLLFIHLSPYYDMFLVRSESMVPAINMGDLIITGPVNGTIRPGTVVTYALGEMLVTHRVISVDGNTIVTKGDAVEDPDPVLSPCRRSGESTCSKYHPWDTWPISCTLNSAGSLLLSCPPCCSWVSFSVKSSRRC